jgi:hypothetical protein
MQNDVHKPHPQSETTDKMGRWALAFAAICEWAAAAFSFDSQVCPSCAALILLSAVTMTFLAIDVFCHEHP